MDEVTPIPLSALEHYLYCPRQCALILVDGVWADNAGTVRGQHGHRRVDHGPDSTSRGVRVLRALPLFSETYGLTGRADAVEVHPDGRLVPVEYKIGTRHGETADVQLCAQAVCLEEMSGQHVAYGLLWLSAHRRRQRIDFDDDLRRQTLRVVELVRGLFDRMPLPVAVDDERCPPCQFLGHCLPGIVAQPSSVTRYVQREVLQCG